MMHWCRHTQTQSDTVFGPVWESRLWFSFNHKENQSRKYSARLKQKTAINCSTDKRITSLLLMLMVKLVNPKWGLNFYETNSEIRSSPHFWPCFSFLALQAGLPLLLIYSVYLYLIIHCLMLNSMHLVSRRWEVIIHLYILYHLGSRAKAMFFFLSTIQISLEIKNMDSYWENNGRALNKNRCFHTQVALHQLYVRAHHSILCNSPFYYLEFGRFISMRLAK